MCQFDFSAMFWQIPLAKEPRNLFSFYTGEFGTYQFNRVAMGDLNSSIYTQRMVTHMFQGVKLRDGRPLLNNCLLVMTDDVLLHARSIEEMIHILDLFLHTVACHKMSLAPKKTRLFCTSTIYCGHKITRQGITVDPARIQGLREMPKRVMCGNSTRRRAGSGRIYLCSRRHPTF